MSLSKTDLSQTLQSLVLISAFTFCEALRPAVNTVKLKRLTNRVLVAPKATGICGSDVHYLKHGTSVAGLPPCPAILIGDVGRIADFIVKEWVSSIRLF